MRYELKNYLVKNGVRQDHIAKILGVSSAMVSMYLSGKEDFGERRQGQLREFLDSKK